MELGTASTSPPLVHADASLHIFKYVIWNLFMISNLWDYRGRVQVINSSWRLLKCCPCCKEYGDEHQQHSLQCTAKNPAHKISLATLGKTIMITADSHLSQYLITKSHVTKPTTLKRALTGRWSRFLLKSYTTCRSVTVNILVRHKVLHRLQ